MERRHGTGLDLALETGADDHVGLVPGDGGDQFVHFLGEIAEIGVQKYDDIIRSQCGDAGQAGLAISASRFVDHAGAILSGQVGRRVCRSVVYHQDFVHPGGNCL